MSENSSSSTDTSNPVQEVPETKHVTISIGRRPPPKGNTAAAKKAKEVAVIVSTTTEVVETPVPVSIPTEVVETTVPVSTPNEVVETPVAISTPNEVVEPKIETLTTLIATMSLTESTAPIPIQNKGTGAGGANTNLNGKTFEKKTENESRLLSNGFARKPIPGKKGIHDFYLEKVESADKRIVYLTQGGLKSYFKHFLNKEMCRSPDEAYLFCNGDSYTLKILEKKNQNTEGSVDTKLLAGRGFIDEYEYLLGENYTVQYGFCISDFLKKSYVADIPKSRALRYINQKYGIAVLFGDDANYYETLDAWISS